MLTPKRSSAAFPECLSARTGDKPLNQPGAALSQTGHGARPLTQPPRIRAKSPGTRVPCLFLAVALAIVFVAGCASTDVTSQQMMQTGKLPRPNRILVYDFAASPADVPPESAFAVTNSTQLPPQTPQQLAAARQAGAELAGQLVAELRAMDLVAEHASADTKPRLNDIILRGYFLSVDEGSATKRIVIGFGAGASSLQTAVEGFQMTTNGLRRLGADTVKSGGNKTPGAAASVGAALLTGNPLGLIVGGGVKLYGEASGSSTIQGRADKTAKAIAEALKPRFKEQGWIN